MLSLERGSNEGALMINKGACQGSLAETKEKCGWSGEVNVEEQEERNQSTREQYGLTEVDWKEHKRQKEKERRELRDTVSKFGERM